MGPQGVITDGNIIVGDGWAQDAGIYEFTMGIDGSKVLARYSFIYVYEDGEWKISHHHSSVMPEALLAPVSATPRTNYDLIKDYFDSFCQKKPQGVITEGNIIVGEGWAQDAGVYEFTMGIDDSKVLARYSFIYVYEDGEWKISHHHSSVMPEALLAPVLPTPTKEEVRGLFDLWNGALATLDSEQVANRYSKEAVLLPTVSDTPRTNYDLIKDY